MKLNINVIRKLSQKTIGEKLVVNGEVHTVSANRLLPNQEQQIELDNGKWVVLVNEKKGEVRWVKSHRYSVFGRKFIWWWPHKLLNIG